MAVNNIDHPLTILSISSPYEINNNYKYFEAPIDIKTIKSITFETGMTKEIKQREQEIYNEIMRLVDVSRQESDNPNIGMNV